LPKDTNIFIEIKTNIKNLEENNINIKKICDKFYESYKNTAYNEIPKKYPQKKKAYYLLYDNNREDALELLKDNLFIENLGEVEVQYNSGYVQISSLVSLQNNLRVINNKIIEQEEEIIYLKEKEITLQKEIEDLKENTKKEMEKYKNDINTKMQENLIKMEVKIRMDMAKNLISEYPIKLESITIALKKTLSNNNMSFIRVYNIINRKYKEGANLINDNQIIKLCNESIGIICETNEKKQAFLDLIDSLNNKTKENSIARDYYDAFRKCLIGTDWKIGVKPQNMSKIDVFSKSKTISDILKNIIKFICFLEIYDDLENHFLGAVLYYVSMIQDPEFYASFYLYANENDIKKTIINFIKNLNKDNCSQFMKQFQKNI
jgi:hypothetical protein